MWEVLIAKRVWKSFCSYMCSFSFYLHGLCMYLDSKQHKKLLPWSVVKKRTSVCYLRVLLCVMIIILLSYHFPKVDSFTKTAQVHPAKLHWFENGLHRNTLKITQSLCIYDLWCSYGWVCLGTVCFLWMLLDRYDMWLEKLISRNDMWLE